MSTPPFTLPSFAKINWSLRVLGRREDGYHEVRTLLQTVSLQDELSFAGRETPDIGLSCNDPEIPLDERNLIVRAANALRDHFEVRAGASIHLEKRIPAKGGLGGASSNAAVALLGLTRLWNVPASLDDLQGIGACLGADVPFFFIGGCALATGTGTDIEAVGDRHKYLLIVTPTATVATINAYAALRAPALTTSREVSILSSSRAAADLELSHLYLPQNDFEKVIFASEPEIERAKEALIKVGAGSSLLAGSGSSVFGIFESKEEQARAIREMEAETGWRVFPAVTVSRDEYLRALGTCIVTLSRSEKGSRTEQSET
ncbi:MAG: 4-diphosphocytidyl-2C-methyl-D-erythritol kinase [Acidobacteria bacterium]|nr:4-diphosphocytidyl-2C-methyl-D-erythritol kinase [Acidobacteriota bacterium]